MANCKHESSVILYEVPGSNGSISGHICLCESTCGNVLYEDRYGRVTAIIAPDSAMKEQRDQLAAQVEALAIENEALKKEIGELLAIQYGLLIQAGTI